MKRIAMMLLTVGVAYTIGISAEEQKKQIKPDGYEVHDMTQSRPDIIRPGKTDDMPPSDAIVLFDGTNMNSWEHRNQKPDAPKWRIVNGTMHPVKDAGSIRTKKEFGSMQLHVEWRTPEKVVGTGQERGNSGISLMSAYEVQVLNSWQKSTEEYDNPTYADGQAASIYGQKPPLVNASRGPHQWQTYDIIFHRPIFKGNSNEVERPATVTVIHNGVLVQDHWKIQGATRHKRLAEHRYHADKMPIQLQDHGNPTEYRNIWVRELKD